MSEIILDISPNTHKNQIGYIKKMIDAIADIDTHKHTIIFKHQLFLKAMPNLPLDRTVFAQAYEHAKARGYKTTASVFDMPSLYFLTSYEIPFIKIACNEEYHWLVGEIPRKYQIYCSVSGYFKEIAHPVWKLCCIPEYPAPREKYKKTFHSSFLKRAISDHTIGLDLFREYQPAIWEKHLVLHKNKPDNPDSGEFSVTPEELRQIL